MTLVRWTLVPFVLSLFVLAGCGGDSGNGSGGGSGSGGSSSTDAVEVSELEGDVTIDGSSTVYPIAEAIGEDFQTPYPKVKPTIGTSGTGGGFKRFTAGDTDVSNASRPIKKGEYDQCKAKGVHFIEVPVAYDGLTVVINNENDWVKQLTVDELKKIFREPGAKTWKEVNESFPDEAIKIYAPGTDSGTFDYFKEVIVGKEKEAAIRADMSVSEDDNVLVTGVKGEKYAIGFFGAAYYFENKDDLQAVPIVNADGNAVSPNPEAIESGEYNPFSRPLFIYVNVDSLDRPEVGAFVNYFIDNAAGAAEKVGYVALPEAIYERARDHVENRITGTHFMTEDGEKREGSTADLYVEENAVDFE